LVIILPLLLSGCWFDKTISSIKQKIASSGDTKWTYEKTITDPIKAKSGDADAMLGDLQANKVQLAIAKNTFDTETEVEIKTPESVPDYYGQEVKMLGAPLEISVGDQKRLNEPAVITFKFNKNDLDMQRGTSSIRVAYFSGEKWEYIKPDAIDMDKETITFTTYHFSLFGANQIKDDTVITESWIHSQTLDKQMKSGLNKVSDKVAEQIIDMTLEKMGISDKSLKGKVLADVLKDDGYKGIYDAYKSGDVIDLNQKIAVLAGKKIAEIAGESAVQEGLKNLTEGTEDVAAVAKAAGYIAGGQYKDAAKVIGEQIADKFIITAAGKVAVEVVDGQIQSWKNNEVEAAYTAYRDGSNAKFYGYNNEKNDFDTVWTQMRGVSRQLTLEAIKKENAIRSESGMPPLTEKQMDRVRDSVKESYRKQFETRSSKEEELKKEEAKLRSLVDAFKRNNLFDTTIGPAGLDKGLDFENKLSVLYHFAQKMMADTKRFDLSDKNGLVMDDKISVDDLAQGARLWFTVPDGRQQYAKFLKDRFKIVLFPELSKLAGTWLPGKLKIVDVIVPPGYKEQIEANKNKPKTGTLEDGCDLNIDFTQLKGKEVPATISIKPTGESTAVLTLTADKPMTFDASYNDGVLTGNTAQKGGSIAISLPITEEEKSYTTNGNVTMTLGEIKIIATLSASKSSVPAPVKQDPSKKKK